MPMDPAKVDIVEEVEQQVGDEEPDELDLSELEDFLSEEDDEAIMED